MPAWPAIAVIHLDGYGRTPDSDVSRTPFEDLSVRQAKIARRVMDVRSFTFSVKLSDKATMDQWLRDNTNTWFDFADLEDQATRQVRIRGGQGTVEMVAGPEGRRLNGERFFTGSIELEGYWQ